MEDYYPLLMEEVREALGAVKVSRFLLFLAKIHMSRSENTVFAKGDRFIKALIFLFLVHPSYLENGVPSADFTRKTKAIIQALTAKNYDSPEVKKALKAVFSMVIFSRIDPQIADRDNGITPAFRDSFLDELRHEMQLHKGIGDVDIGELDETTVKIAMRSFYHGLAKKSLVMGDQRDFVPMVPAMKAIQLTLLQDSKYFAHLRNRTMECDDDRIVLDAWCLAGTMHKFFFHHKSISQPVFMAMVLYSIITSRRYPDGRPVVRDSEMLRRLYPRVYDLFYLVLDLAQVEGSTTAGLPRRRCREIYYVETKQGAIRPSEAGARVSNKERFSSPLSDDVLPIALSASPTGTPPTATSSSLSSAPTSSKNSSSSRTSTTSKNSSSSKSSASSKSSTSSKNSASSKKSPVSKNPTASSPVSGNPKDLLVSNHTSWEILPQTPDVVYPVERSV
jgi:hypothetical protein